MFFGFLRKIVELERYVDTEEEGFVKCLDTTGGEEEDTTIVLDARRLRNKGKGSEYNLRVGHIELFLTYNTATIAFLSKSCIENISLKKEIVNKT